MPVKHLFNSGKTDGADATLVKPSNWNADHALINSTVTPTTSGFGDAGAIGTSNEPALADHRHGREIDPVPTGAIMPYAGTAAPAGWLICNGRLVSTTTYAALFAVLGHVYNGGVDPGGGQFRLPELSFFGSAGQGRYPLGVRSSGTGSVQGDSGGSMDHAHNDHALVADHGSHSSVGLHTHDNHSAAAVIAGKTAGALNGSSATVGGANAAGAGHDHLAGTLANSGTHSNVGGHTHDAHTAHSGTHNTNNQPWQTFLYIIAI